MAITSLGASAPAVSLLSAMTIDAASFLWSAFWIQRIEAAEATAPVSAADHPLRDIAEGWRACREHPIVFPLLTAQSVFGLFAGFFSTIYKLFTLRTLGLDAATVGVIIGVGGIGALWGAAAAGPIARFLGYGRAIVACLALWAAASAFIPAAEGQDALKIPFLVGRHLIGDGFLSAFMILSVSVRQTALDADVQARAGATFHAAEGLSLPIGALIAGPLADVVGTGAVLWIAIAGVSVPLAILTLSRLWRLDTLEDARVAA